MGTQSALTIEPLNGCLRNLVGLKFSWSLTSVVIFNLIRPGADPGRGKNGPGGPLLQRTFSSDWKATATNQMHSNDVEACVM